MFEFELACKEMERLDPARYQEFIAEKSGNIIRAFTEFAGDEETATQMFTGVLLGAVISDGKVSKVEFDLVKPLLDVALGREISYEDAAATIKKLVPDPKQYTSFINTVTDFFGRVSDSLKKDIVIVCLLVCSIDGKISFRERKWLKQLAK